jgi:GNAT superfamily N-acetyltransferase
MSVSTLEVEIMEFRPEFREHFKQLNLAWIEAYFTVEPPDVEVLSNPEGHVLKNGGAIFFARLGDDIVGTCAMLKRDATTYELAKMAVTPRVQGRKIGKKLGLAVIAKARQLGARTVVLETSDRLPPALALYAALGFVRVNPPKGHHSPYRRSNVYMELDLAVAGPPST